jgi:hypothetical protein
MKQTALEWLIEETKKGIRGGDAWLELLEQAKEMEKQQIINAWEDVGADGVTTAEEYYNETFKNTNK